MKVRYRDLSIKDPRLKSELLAAVAGVLGHGRFILGPEHDRFEGEVARFCRRRYAVGVGSGSAALHFALQALGIGPGDEVITTPLSWIATTNAIVLTGATPVFVDIGEDLNLDPGLVEAAITAATRAVLPVHFTGQICDIGPILAIAEARRLAVVEDAAQAFGAEVEGRPAGSFGRLACFSMNPMKVFAGYGEAGAVVTDDEALRDKLRALRYAGTVDKEDCHYPSLNGRLDTLQAAMLLVGLKYLEGRIAARRSIAAAYTRALGDGGALAGLVVCPREKEGFRHIYYAYTILAERRDALAEFLLAKGVETKIQHPVLMPYHTAYRGRFSPRIPVAERLVQRILCLPCHQETTAEEINFVVTCIRQFYGVSRP